VRSLLNEEFTVNRTALAQAALEIEMLPTPVLTLHAMARYRRRVQANATQVEIGEALGSATIRKEPPGWMKLGLFERNDVAYWALSGHVAWPLVWSGDHQLLAVTCIRKRRIPKADRRAYRDEIRHGWAA
jgi:hypothetical protein